jgi:cytidyltransferase-like protein
MLPNFFCDRKFDEIRRIENGAGWSVPVLSPAEVADIGKDIDVLITIMDAELELSDICSALENERFAVTVCKIEICCGGAALHFGAGKVMLDWARYISSYFEIIRNAYSRSDNYCSLSYLNAMLVDSSVRIVDEDIVLPNLTNKYMSHDGNERHTAFKTGVYENKLFFFGDSRTYGHLIEDRYTYCSCLQKLLNGEAALSFEVVNRGFVNASYAGMYYRLTRTNLNRGDVVFFAHTCFFPDMEIPFLLDAKQHCETRGAKFVFVNLPLLSEGYQTDDEKFLYKLFFLRAEADRVGITRNTLLDLRDQGVQYCDLTGELLRCNRGRRESFYIDLFHFGSNGNIWIADELFTFLKSFAGAARPLGAGWAEKEKAYSEFIEFVRLTSDKNSVSEYVSKLAREYKKPDCPNAGAVVVNCNPFTKGHLHLIEQALAQVDFLYIFVVEEDKSEFPFETRFRLVREGVSHLGNVAVVPSGRFILSSLTFAGYFSRDDSKKDIIDASKDLTIFATEIAPKMGIKKRFVGDEPFSAVTNHYHEQMKEILPAHGVEVVVVPRLLTSDGRNVISASTVRGLIKKQDWDELKKYVPENTFSFVTS